MGTLLVLLAGGIALAVAALGGWDWRRQSRRAASRLLRDDPHAPQRIHFLFFAAFIFLVSVYRSTVPFEFRLQSVASAGAQFESLRVGEPDDPPPPFEQTVLNSLYYATFESSDYLANFLMGLPWGFLALAAFAVDRPRRTRLVAFFALLLGSAALRFVLEFSQYWIYSRHPSMQDVAADALGIACGGLAWLVAGQTTTDWLRSKAITHRRARPIDAALIGYLLALLAFQLMPLELSLRGADVARKFRAGRITLIPFHDFESSSGWLWQLAGVSLLHVPIGVFAAITLTSLRRPIRSWGNSLIIGGMAVLLLEGVQLFVMNRTASTTDLLAALLGMVVGVAGAQLFAEPNADPERDLFRSALGLREVWPPLAGAAGYALVVMLAKCWPYEPLRDTEQVRLRFVAAFHNPLTALVAAPASETGLAFVQQGLWYLPLGLCLALSVVGPTVPLPMRRVLMAALLAVPAGVAFAVEMFQVYLPPHVAAMSDVLLAVLGAALGMMLVTLAARSRVKPPAKPRRPATGEH